MVEERDANILKTLKKTFAMPKWVTSHRDPFKTLIMAIISQNTADRNTAKAFENLSNRFEIIPEVLANATARETEECLKVAGLYRNKAKAIKRVSSMILEKYHGGLEHILSLPLEEARKALVEFPRRWT